MAGSEIDIEEFSGVERHKLPSSRSLPVKKPKAAPLKFRDVAPQ